MLFMQSRCILATRRCLGLFLSECLDAFYDTFNTVVSWHPLVVVCCGNIIFLILGSQGFGQDNI